MSKPRGKIINEQPGVFSIAPTYKETRDQLGVCAKRRPSVYVTITQHAAFTFRDVLFLCIAEGPNLVTLDVFAAEVTERPILVNHERLAGINQHLGNRILAHASQTRNAAN